ncbi:MAG: hypothetical protein QGF38_08760 [Rhodospirillales bacterium]|jgi:hypothetical protein|nr:hypothetical protein [Rhodospirillales bacterium]
MTMVDAVSGLSGPTLSLKSFRASLADQSRNTIERKRVGSIGLTTSRTALNQAVSAGKIVQEFLTELRSTIIQASMEGVVADSQSARFSRQGEVAVMLGQIDQAVSLAAHEGINIISSNGNAVRLQTNSTGGALDVQPQPLDVVGLRLSELAITPMDLLGLGLSDLGIISDKDVAEALEKVDRAILIAGSRLDNLVGFQSVFAGASDFLTQINPTNLSVDATSLPPGTFLNIVT